METSICIHCHSPGIERKKINQRVFFHCKNCGKTAPYSFTRGGKIKEGQAKSGLLKHYTAGAVIEKQGKVLLLERSFFPFAFAGIAGHLHEGEKPEACLKREIKEETGLKVKSLKKLLHEERAANPCSRGIQVHEWWLYKAACTGKLKKSQEAITLKYYPKEELNGLNLEPVWRYFFRKLKLLK